MKALASFAMIAVLLSLPGGMARGGECKGGHCPRPVCFNLVCSFGKDPPPGTAKCEAAGQFFKDVQFNGDEILDRSSDGDDSIFEVSCSDTVLFNGSAHRYTDWLGTRLQAVIGPYPAVVLPVGSLREQRGYVPASLELVDGRVDGYCFIYTGPQ